MAFVPEDGTGFPDANSYGFVEDADDYFTDRGNAAWIAFPDEKKQACLIQATDYIDSYYGARFIGTPTTTTQALEWPRTDAEGFDADEIPEELKRATYEYAMRASVGPLMPDPIVGSAGVGVVTVKEKVGEIEREYQPIGGYGAQVMYYRPYPAADLLLQDLLRKGYGGDRVIR